MAWPNNAPPGRRDGGGGYYDPQADPRLPQRRDQGHGGPRDTFDDRGLQSQGGYLNRSFDKQITVEDHWRPPSTRSSGRRNFDSAPASPAHWRRGQESDAFHRRGSSSRDPRMHENNSRSSYHEDRGNASRYPTSRRSFDQQAHYDSPAPAPRAPPRHYPPEFEVPLPPPTYIEFSRQLVVPSDEVTPKLLVLDLNGALVYRHKGSGDKRKAHPRPFLGCFLEYLFAPEPQGGPRPWEVFVWSSAQPHNVRHMVETAMGHWCEGIWVPEPKDLRQKRIQRGEGRLLKVWARDRMALGNDYHRKVQTTKDLRKVCDELHNVYDERTVVLLDDSPLKAVYQPWSQIIIPEFDKTEHQDSRAAAEKYAKSRQSDVGDSTGESGMDTVLVAVVGVLDAMRTVSNVPAWVRRGGIQHGEPASSFQTEVTLETLPSHETFTHWFRAPKIYEYWVDRGKEALRRKGIVLRDGLSLDPPMHSPVPPKDPSAQQQDTFESSTSKLTQTLPAALAMYQHLQTIADGPLVDSQQRSTLLSALGVLNDIGMGSAENRSTVELKAGPVGASQARVEHATRSTAARKVSKKDIRWMKSLTPEVYVEKQHEAAALESTIASLSIQSQPDKNTIARERAALDILRHRLALVTVEPGPDLDLLIKELSAKTSPRASGSNPGSAASTPGSATNDIVGTKSKSESCKPPSKEGSSELNGHNSSGGDRSDGAPTPPHLKRKRKDLVA